ncbi:MAG: hypothetical protein ACD_75C02499G0002 [uncultured bacterium]|nr:MAG: hypothetical protein ACD_75C02499G0002 [uncultured bacterium]
MLVVARTDRRSLSVFVWIVSASYGLWILRGRKRIFSLPDHAGRAWMNVSSTSRARRLKRESLPGAQRTIFLDTVMDTFL